MFSPYYRASGRTDPFDHVAMNVCLYGPQSRWTMTERGRRDISRSAGHIAIGPSSLRVAGDTIVADLDERATPLPRRVAGRVIIHPRAVNRTTFTLDPAGLHTWHPPAPVARVEVEMTAPAVSWAGEGYLDINAGDEPLEAGFRTWNWSRSRLRDGAAVFYEGSLRSGDPFALSLRFDRDGRAEQVAPPPLQKLRPTGWLVARSTRADPGARSRIVRTLEDTPFYARTALAAAIFGETAPTMHESVDLDRYASRWVQTLLPYRMPRKPTR